MWELACVQQPLRWMSCGCNTSILEPLAWCLELQGSELWLFTEDIVAPALVGRWRPVLGEQMKGVALGSLRKAGARRIDVWPPWCS